ncbi:MAG: response regulator [Deltaproteobacteria bacterium]|nr:MAG: response regulator [Deltaproteobacteria bacterium]
MTWEVVLFEPSWMSRLQTRSVVVRTRVLWWTALGSPVLFGGSAALTWASLGVEERVSAVASVALSAVCVAVLLVTRSSQRSVLAAVVSGLAFVNLLVALGDGGVTGAVVTHYTLLILVAVSLLETSTAWLFAGLVLLNLAGWWVMVDLGYFGADVDGLQAGRTAALTLGGLWFAAAGSYRARLDAHQLQRERELRFSLFAGLPDGIMVLDERPLRVEAFYGPEGFPLLPRPGMLAEVVPPAIASLLELAVAKLESADHVIDVDFWVGERLLEGRLAGIDGSRVVVQLRDATESHLAREAAEEAAQAAEEAALAQKRFLATMSHEIRTPLNAIVGLSDVLQRGEVLPEQRAHIDLLRAASSNLLGLIDHILDYNRLELGGVHLERVPTEIGEVVEEVVGPWSQLSSGARVHWHQEGELPLRVSLDRARFSQILQNLVSNAVKFTAEGEVEVTVAWEAASTEPGEVGLVRVTVRDTGIGMTPEQLASARQPFMQAEQGARRKYGGTGLGLAISSGLAELMGGGLEIRSEHGLGTTCTVRVRAEVEEVTRIAPLPVVPLVDRRVLLVDDNHTNRLVMNLLLKPLAMEVVEAGNGQEAIDRFLDSGPFDLVLMDLHMPVLDGFEATAEIRKHDAEVPIIAVTADAIRDVREDIEGAGMNGILTKPVSPDGLRDAVSRHLLVPG